MSLLQARVRDVEACRQGRSRVVSTTRAVRNTVSLECHQLHKYPCLHPVSVRMDDEVENLDYSIQHR
jgi:hypothetical protein